MTKTEVLQMFEGALVAVDVPAGGLEVRIERKKKHSLFYKGKLLGLYSHQNRTLKTADNKRHHTDTATPAELGLVLLELLKTWPEVEQETFFLFHFFVFLFHFGGFLALPKGQGGTKIFSCSTFCST